MRPHTLPLLPTRCRSMSLDSGASLGSFIASDDELDGWLSEGEYGPGGGEGGEGDWRAALREATGGCVAAGAGAGLCLGCLRGCTRRAAAIGPPPSQLQRMPSLHASSPPWHAMPLCPLPCRYDPSKFQHIDRQGDRGMEAG